MNTLILFAMTLALAGPNPSSRPLKPVEPKPSPAAEPSKEKPVQPASVPSLDDALGLSSTDKNPKPSTATRDQIDKALSGEEEGDDLKQAVALMNLTSKRLDKARDTGVETQRLQEDTIRKLDALIKKSSQKKQCANPNKDCDKPSDQQQQQDQPQPDQSQQSQQNAKEQQAKAAQAAQDAAQAARKDGQLRPSLDAARAAWGNLPERVRQMLMQGSGDQFSKEYQKMTEEYYKKLGEQGK